MPDYECYPLWKTGGNVGPIDPASLSISTGLLARLNAWAQAYDATLDYTDP